MKLEHPPAGPFLPVVKIDSVGKPLVADIFEYAPPIS
jgi:hypothetical protein